MPLSDVAFVGAAGLIGCGLTGHVGGPATTGADWVPGATWSGARRSCTTPVPGAAVMGPLIWSGARRSCFWGVATWSVATRATAAVGTTAAVARPATIRRLNLDWNM